MNKIFVLNLSSVVLRSSLFFKVSESFFIRLWFDRSPVSSYNIGLPHSLQYQALTAYTKISKRRKIIWTLPQDFRLEYFLLLSESSFWKRRWSSSGEWNFLVSPPPDPLIANPIVELLSMFCITTSEMDLNVIRIYKNLNWKSGHICKWSKHTF